MAKLPTYEEMAQEVAQRALDECEYEGKTIREWIEIIKAQPAHGTDTISRRAAIGALNEYFDRIGKLKRRGLNEGEKAIRLDTVGAINSLPSAQPKRGHWNHNDKYGTFKVWTCDQCGWNYEAKYKYCPNCGAKMEGSIYE